MAFVLGVRCWCISLHRLLSDASLLHKTRCSLPRQGPRTPLPRPIHHSAIWSTIQIRYPIHHLIWVQLLKPQSPILRPNPLSDRPSILQPDIHPIIWYSHTRSTIHVVNHPTVASPAFWSFDYAVVWLSAYSCFVTSYADGPSLSKTSGSVCVPVRPPSFYHLSHFSYSLQVGGSEPLTICV